MNTATPPQDGTPSDFRLTVGTIMVSIAFVMELTVLPLLLGTIQEDLGLDVTELAWVFNSYAIAVAVAVLFTGFLGDVFDRRRLFTLGTVLFIVGSVLSAASGDLNGLIAGRIVQGLGGGLFFPLVPVLLTQANETRSGKILMIWGGLVGVVAALLPVLGGAMLSGLGWRSLFLAISAVALVGLPFVALGQSTVRRPRRLDVPNYRQLFTIPSYWPLLAYIFLTYGSFSYYLFFFPVSWHKQGFDGHSISVLLTCVWVSFATLSFLLRNKVEGIGLRRSLVFAPGLFALCFALAVFDLGNYTLQALSALLAGAGLACCNSPSTHLLLRLAPNDLRAFSSSLDITFARCGSAVTVAFLSALGPFSVVLAITVISAAAILSSQFFLRAQPVSDQR